LECILQRFDDSGSVHGCDCEVDCNVFDVRYVLNPAQPVDGGFNVRKLLAVRLLECSLAEVLVVDLENVDEHAGGLFALLPRTEDALREVGQPQSVVAQTHALNRERTEIQLGVRLGGTYLVQIRRR